MRAFGHDQVQRGVHQRRMQREIAGFATGTTVGAVATVGAVGTTSTGGTGLRRLGQDHVREQLILPAPGRPERPEGGTVVVAASRQPLIEIVDLDPFGALGRPHVETGGRHVPLRREDTLGVQRPLLFVGVVLIRSGARTRMQPHGSIPRRVGRVHCDPDMDRGVHGKQHGAVQGELLQPPGTDPASGVQRQFRAGRSRQQDSPHDHMVGQPRLGLYGQPAGQQQTTGAGRRALRAEQQLGRGHGCCGGGLGGHRRGGRYRGGCGGQPEAFPLESVCGQVDAACPGPGEDPTPVQLHPGGEQRRERAGHGLVVGPVPAQQRNPCRGGRRGTSEALVRHRGQHAVRPEFAEPRHTGRFQPAHAVVEAHRLTRVPHPVVGVGETLRGGQLAGEAGDDGNPRRREHHGPRDLPELLQHAVHVRGVEGVAGAQARRRSALFPQGLRDRVHGPGVAGDHRGRRAVHGGDGDLSFASVVTGQQRGDLGFAGRHRHHRAGGGQGLHQPAAGCDQRGRVGQRQHPGDMRRRQLADRVPDEEVRPHTP